MKTQKKFISISFSLFLLISANLKAQNSNLYLGANSLPASRWNVALGFASGTFITSGLFNTFTGTNAGYNFTAGISNAFFGANSGPQFNSSTLNSYNTFIGGSAAPAITNGEYNTILGYNCAANLISGNNNTFIGSNLTFAASTTLSNTIIIGDGTGAPRIYVNSSGNTGLGTTSPNNKLEINQGTANNSGLRFTNLTNMSSSITNSSNEVLSVNSSGDVILVHDKQGTGSGGVTNSCITNGFVPVTATSGTSLTCSQIYDNGTSVGISSTESFAYSSPSTVGSMGTITSGTLKLDVNGTMRVINMYATSDEKFKSNIKPITSALETVLKLQGKTYNWKKEEFKNYNFSNDLQYGLIAQEVQKILPSLVIKMENEDLALNYTGLIPVLIEAIKQQQSQIDDLKNQISENFKLQNTDLINLSNTKIISVSPNPSNDIIAVSLNIEKSVANARLMVYDLKGTMLSNLTINERDNNIVKTLQKDNFGQGIYIVSLVVNGKSIDTKKIIFN